MINIAFIPKWYIEERQRKKHKKLKILICLMFIFNLCCLDYILWNKYKIRCLEEKIKTYDLDIEKGSKKEFFGNKDSLISLEKIIEKLPNYIKVKSINVEGKKVDIKLNFENEDKYLDLIKALEKSGIFNLINVSIIGNESSNRYIDIEMERKK